MLAWALAAILGLGGAPAQARRAVQRPAPAAAATPDEAFVQARQAALQNDLARFDAAAARVGATPLREYLDYWRLRIRIAPARPEAGADADVAAFLERNAGTAVAEQMRRDWLASLGRRGEWATFDAQFAQWAPRDDAQVQCWAWMSATQRGEPLPPDARDALMQPRELGEGCGALVEALARSGALKRADVWRRLELALEAGAAGSVRRLGPLAGMTDGSVEAALQRPAKVLSPDVSAEVAVIALAQLARQDPDSAAERTDALRALPPPQRAFAWSQIAAHAMRKLSPRALDYTREALAARASDETWVWLARAALRGGDWKTLAAVVERMSPQGRRDPAWVYWNARAQRALGRRDEADAQLRTIAGQFHFYGQLAAEELGELTSLPARAAPPTDDEIAQAAGNAGFERALRFYELGLRVEGNREWNFQLRTMNDRQLLAAAEWACRGAVLDRCVNTADRTVAEHDFALRFVTPFRAQLAPLAQERGLDPAWIYGLIRQESRFIMDVRSSAGAQGLMQIIPPTARWIANRLGVKDFHVDQLNDMGTNLRFGTYYLKSVLDDLEGSPLLASAAYNAGPNRPRTWRSTLPATVEGAVFAEIIPFTETRDYVKKVLSNATFYASLLTGRPQSLKSWLGSVAPRAPRGSELP